MGASRMGFDLLTPMGRKNFRYVWTMRHTGYRIQWKLTAADTLMPLLCRVLGHKPYNSDGETACGRCHKYLPAHD